MKIMYHPRLPKAERLILDLVRDAHDQQLLPAELQSLSLPAIEMGRPHLVREISLRDLAAGADLDDAEVAGVRYLLRDGRTTSAAVDLAVDGDGPDELSVDAADRSASIQALVSGEHVHRVDRILQRIEAPATKGARMSALSLLRCRGLNVDALVLEPIGGGEAQIFPLHHGPAPLRERAYDERAFFDALQPEAERVLDQYARDRSGESRVG